MKQQQQQYKTTTEICYETKAEYSGEITDEYLFRQLTIRLINDLSFEDLSKLIKFTKTDPFTRDGIKLMRDPTIDPHEKERINLLRARGVILYEAEVSV
jgi:hypothetical protein